MDTMAATVARPKRAKSSKASSNLKEKNNMIVQSSIFDLNTFAEVKLGREFNPSPAFTSLQEAMAFYGNDEAKMLKALNDDKLAVEESAARKIPLTDDGWLVLDEEEKLTAEKFAGTPVNEKVLNDLILNLAKQHFGFEKNISIEAKRIAKSKAIDFVKATPELIAYLKVMAIAPPATAAA
jgi:hypothetical protein